MAITEKPVDPKERALLLKSLSPKARKDYIEELQKGLPPTISETKKNQSEPIQVQISDNLDLDLI